MSGACRRRHGLRLVGLVALGLGVVLAAGCAASRGVETPRAKAQRLSDVYARCAHDQAASLVPRTDLSPQDVATTALDRCQSHWRAFTHAAQVAYVGHTRQISEAHLAAMTDGYQLNIRLADALREQVRTARAGQSDTPAGAAP